MSTESEIVRSLRSKIQRVVDEYFPEDAIYMTDDSGAYDSENSNVQYIRYGSNIGEIGSSISKRYVIIDTTENTSVNGIKDINLTFDIIANPASSANGIPDEQSVLIYDETLESIIRVQPIRRYFPNNVHFGYRNNLDHIYINPNTMLLFVTTAAAHYKDNEYEKTSDSIMRVATTYKITGTHLSKNVSDTSINQTNLGLEPFFTRNLFITKWGELKNEVTKSIKNETIDSSFNVIMGSTKVSEIILDDEEDENETGPEFMDTTTATSTPVNVIPNLDGVSMIDSNVSKYDSIHGIMTVSNGNNLSNSIISPVEKNPDVYDRFLIMPGQSIYFKDNYTMAFTTTSKMVYLNTNKSIYTPNPITGVLQRFTPRGSNVIGGKFYSYDSMTFDSVSGIVTIR